MKITKTKLREIIREELTKLTEKPLKKNPKVWVPDAFDKVIDKLPFRKLTKKNVIKLAKKFKVDTMDALKWVSYNQDVDFGLKEDILSEAKCGVGQNPEDTGCTPASKVKIPKFKGWDIKTQQAKWKKQREERFRKDKLYKNKDRKPNIVDGVDVIKDKKDLEHYVYDFENKGDKIKGHDETSAYDDLMRDRYSKQNAKLSPKQKKQLRGDISSWKSYGGYEAIQNAIESGDISEQDIRDRNKRISDLSHNTVTKVEQPIERGIRIPNEDLKEFMSRFKIDDMVDIPDETGHGSSGFSTSSKIARSFSGSGMVEGEASIVMRIEPNSKGEVRGLFVDGEKAEHGGYWDEGEITRSHKSKSKVTKIETVKYPNGNVVKIITMVEPEDLTEVIVREEKDSVDILSKKYLEGPLNPKSRIKKKEVKEDIETDVIQSFVIRNSLNPKLWEDNKMKITKTKLREIIREELTKLTEAKKPISFKLGGVTFGKDYQGLKSRNGGIRYYYQKRTGPKNMESDFGKFIVKIGGLVSSSNKNKVAKKLKEHQIKNLAK